MGGKRVKTELLNGRLMINDEMLLAQTIEI